MREENETGRGEKNGGKEGESYLPLSQLEVTYLNITLWKEALFSILQFSLPPAITNILQVTHMLSITHTRLS